MALSAHRVVLIAEQRHQVTCFSHELEIDADNIDRKEWKILPVDLSAFSQKFDLLEHLGVEWGFPEYFGQNLDALEDVLSDEGWNAEAGLIIVVLGLVPALEDPASRALAQVVVEIFSSALRDRVQEGGAKDCATVFLGISNADTSKIIDLFPRLELLDIDARN